MRKGREMVVPQKGSRKNKRIFTAQADDADAAASWRRGKSDNGIFDRHYLRKKLDRSRGNHTGFKRGRGRP